MTVVPPRATYRLQLHAGFTFADAAAAIPYLAELGVSHLYLSPVLQAAAGSMHGYDVVDPEHVSAELGGEHGLRTLASAARSAGLGILLDIVPNHMSIDLRTAGTDNRWWRDVLENGPASFYADAFDVDWPATGNDRVVVPVLGERYGRALTSGVLGVERVGGRVAIRAHDMRFPCSPVILGPVVRAAGRRIGHAELEYVGEALAALPSSHVRDREARRRRHRHRAVLLARLDQLSSDAQIDTALDAELAAINADPSALDALLEGQNYRLVFWKNAADHLPYRRFFDVTTLVGVRCEDPEVLEASHARIFEWLADGTIDGVRVDHVDGLVRPGDYLGTLRSRAPDAWILVEKILGMDERLPAAWPIDGTTGYEHADAVGRLLVDGDGADELAAIFAAYTGQRFDPPAARRAARLEVMTDALHSELERVTDLAVRACKASPACRDYTRPEIQTAIAELLAAFPVYRTYLGEGAPAPEDRGRIAEAAARARAANPGVDGDLVAFLESALAFEVPSPEAQELARVMQQVSGPIVAKGDEDTLAYRQLALAARCEVGADIGALATEPDAIHAVLASAGPRTMLASSTHDTKRAEDVRARMSVLSELPAVWRTAVSMWGERAAGGWSDAPRDRVFEYLMWQTLLGAWPLDHERARTYAEKAGREARVRTSWRAPDEVYERARDRWLAQVYADRTLLGEIEALAARLAPHGDRNSLAMLAIKLTAPGVPDLYQGTELRADSLVDPDNRRAVDLALRYRELRAQRELSPAEIAGDLSRAKLWTIRRVLELRRSAPGLFDGAYRPLRAVGPHGHRVFAFARGDDLVTIVPRLSAAADGWRDTTLELPAGAWRDVLSDRPVAGGTVPVALVWSTLPIAVLASEGARERRRSA